MTAGRRAIVLVGFMGSGKSAVAPLLAARLGREAADADAEIERSLGRPVAAIFSELGEEAFRRAEHEALAALAARGDVVIAAGGGALVRAGTRRMLLSSTTCVWLDLPLGEVRARLARQAPRPLWPADPAAQRALYERRRALYALAPVRVDASGEPDEVAREAARRLHFRPET